MILYPRCVLFVCFSFVSVTVHGQRRRSNRHLANCWLRARAPFYYMSAARKPTNIIYILWEKALAFGRFTGIYTTPGTRPMANFFHKTKLHIGNNWNLKSFRGEWARACGQHSSTCKHSSTCQPAPARASIRACDSQRQHVPASASTCQHSSTCKHSSTCQPAPARASIWARASDRAHVPAFEHVHTFEHVAIIRSRAHLTTSRAWQVILLHEFSLPLRARRSFRRKDLSNLILGFG